MLAEILETQGLEMSATYFIYAILDFKVAIRDSFLSHFSNIEAKGCSFHFQPSSRRFPIMVYEAVGGEGQFSDHLVLLISSYK